MIKAIVNFSGGKDSTAAILKTLERFKKDEIILCYEDTGADYLETKEHIRLIANTLELPLVELAAKDDFWKLALKRKSFPIASCRSCTRMLKLDVIRHFVASHRPDFGNELIVVTGIRAEESLSRSKMNEWCVDEHLTTKAQSVRFWAPCLSLSAKEVKQYVKAEGLPLHPCYDFSERCSCWNCFFQPNSVVRTYAEVHPELLEKACQIEEQIKFKWKEHFGYADLMKQGRLL